MHEDTAYGPIDPATNDGFNLVRRKSADGLSEKDVSAIRDKGLRDAMTAALKAVGRDHKTALPLALETLRATAHWEGLRHVRVMTKEAKPILMPDAAGKIYKGLIAGEIHHIDLFADAAGKWTGRAATLFEARKTALPDGRATPPQAQDGERFVMRLHKGDYVELEHEGKRCLMLVIKLEPSSKSVVVIQPQQTKQDRALHVKIAFNQLGKRGARRVTVDRLGDVYPIRRAVKNAADS